MVVKRKKKNWAGDHWGTDQPTQFPAVHHQTTTSSERGGRTASLSSNYLIPIKILFLPVVLPIAFHIPPRH